MKSKNVIVSMMICFMLIGVTVSVASVGCLSLKADVDKVEKLEQPINSKMKYTDKADMKLGEVTIEIGETQPLFPASDHKLTIKIKKPLPLPLPPVVYVDNDFECGYDHFNNIQDGVDAVAVGGTVIVYDGEYNLLPSIEINKELTLVAAEGEVPVINARGAAIRIEVGADETTVDGFMLISCFGIVILADQCTITNNDFIGNAIGRMGTVGLSIYGSYNKVYHNNFIGCDSFWGNPVWLAPEAQHNTFDGGFVNGGNYWSSYSGTDIYNDESQRGIGSDGIFDSPNMLSPFNLHDRFPFTRENGWEYYDTNDDESVNPMDVGFVLSRLGTGLFQTSLFQMGPILMGPCNDAIGEMEQARELDLGPADVNGDGAVDEIDVAIVAQHFGMTL